MSFSSAAVPVDSTAKDGPANGAELPQLKRTFAAFVSARCVNVAETSELVGMSIARARFVANCAFRARGRTRKHPHVRSRPCRERRKLFVIADCFRVGFATTIIGFSPARGNPKKRFVGVVIISVLALGVGSTNPRHFAQLFH